MCGCSQSLSKDVTSAAPLLSASTVAGKAAARPLDGGTPLDSASLATRELPVIDPTPPSDSQANAASLPPSPPSSSRPPSSESRTPHNMAPSLAMPLRSSSAVYPATDIDLEAARCEA